MASKFDFRPLLELMVYMVVGMLLAAAVTELLFGSSTLSYPVQKPLQFLGAVAVSLLFSFGLPALVWLKSRGTLISAPFSQKASIKTVPIAFALFVSLVFVADYFMNWAHQFLELRGWGELTEEPFNLTSVRDLLVHEQLFPLILLVIAVIPAVVEEFFFRRIIFSYLLQSSRTFWTPAILSALFFAGMHNHFLSFFPIFLLGLALAFAYYTTKNIWTPIVLHAFNNGVSVVLLKFNLADSLSTHWIVALVAALLSAYIFMNHLDPVKEVQNHKE
jgi:membrane protease YdiL (CAAX protease family)